MLLTKKQTNYVWCSQNNIQNDLDITNNDDIHSHETQKKQNDIIPTTSTPNHHAQRICAMSVSLLNLKKPTKLSQVGKKYMCFQNNGKSSQAAKYVTSRIMTKVIDFVLSVDTFEQKCVVLKGMLQSPRIKDHMKTIGIDQSLRNSDIFKHRCLQNINKLYQYSGKCDY